MTELFGLETSVYTKLMTWKGKALKYIPSPLSHGLLLMTLTPGLQMNCLPATWEGQPVRGHAGLVYQER